MLKKELSGMFIYVLKKNNIIKWLEWNVGKQNQILI